MHSKTDFARKGWLRFACDRLANTATEKELATRSAATVRPDWLDDVTISRFESFVERRIEYIRKRKGG